MNMLRRHRYSVVVAAISLALMAGLVVQHVRSAVPVTGGLTAKAASPLTRGRLVKLTAANTIGHATAVTDKVVGVCELTQTATSGSSRYAPVGTITYVDSGEVITTGDYLTGGTGGKAYVLDEDDTSTQRYGAIALTADAVGTGSVRCLVVAGYAEQRVDLPDITAETLTVDDATTPSIALATGKTNTGTITIAGKTSGGLALTTADATAHTCTVTCAALGQGVTLTIPDPGGATANFVLDSETQTLTNKTLDGDDNTVQDLNYWVLKATGSVNDARAQIPFVLEFDVDASEGNLTYTVPAGRKLRVLAGQYVKRTAAGAHADDDLDITDGSNAIFQTEELNTIAEHAVGFLDGVDMTHRDLVAAEVLTIIPGEDGAGAGDLTLQLTCCWITP